MSRDGSGNYSLPAGNPVGTGTTISSTVHNATMTDVAAAITASIAKDGQTTPSANLPMGGYKHTAVANGTARDQYASVAQLQDGGPHVVGSVSGVDTITGTLTPAITGYATGLRVLLFPAGTNTTSATLALNGLAAKNILMPDGNDLLPSDLRANLPVQLVYDGTRFWMMSSNQITGTFTITLTGVSGTVTATASYVRTGRQVSLALPQITGTSNSNAATVTGLPAGIRPTFEQIVWGGFWLNNGAFASQRVDAVVTNTGTLVFYLNGSSTGWTSSGTKGLNGTCILSYVV